MEKVFISNQSKASKLYFFFNLFFLSFFPSQEIDYSFTVNNTLRFDGFQRLKKKKGDGLLIIN